MLWAPAPTKQQREAQQRQQQHHQGHQQQSLLQLQQQLACVPVSLLSQAAVLVQSLASWLGSLELSWLVGRLLQPQARQQQQQLRQQEVQQQGQPQQQLVARQLLLHPPMALSLGQVAGVVLALWWVVAAVQGVQVEGLVGSRQAALPHPHRQPRAAAVVVHQSLPLP